MIINEFSFLKLEGCIKTVIDNNPKVIHETIKLVNNILIPIILLDKMLREISANDCILITITVYEEVIEQLEKIEELNNIEYYIYSTIKTEQYDYERLQINILQQLSIYNEIKYQRSFIIVGLESI